MSIGILASSPQRIVLTNAIPLPRITNPNKPRLISCNYAHDGEDREPKAAAALVAKVAIAAVLAAGVLTMGPVDDASAAKSGGRVGGQAFRSPTPRAAPRINNNNSRTNIYINPPVAPPLVGGYGYGYGGYGGGWGWSPFSFFAPGPSVAVGIGGGFDTFFLFILLGAVAAVVRKFLGSTRDEDEF